jgi:hypothetical protein
VVLLGRWNWWPSKIAVTPAPEGTDAVGASADALGLADSGDSSAADPATDSESRRRNS